MKKLQPAESRQHRRFVFRARRGFTLIELLVVVAIIALLLAILMPSLQAARRQAKTALCAANLRTCGQGIAYYLQANKDVYGGSNWGSLIHKYVQRYSTKQGLPPRVDSGVDEDSVTLTQASAFVEFYLCPGDEFYHPSSSVALRMNGQCKRVMYGLSYGINDSLLYRVGNDPGDRDDILTTTVVWVGGWSALANVTTPGCDGQDNVYQTGMRKSLSVKHPDTIVMLMDAGDDDFSVGIWDFRQTYHNRSKLQVHHKTGNNFLYADYHVEYEKYVKNGYQRGIPPFPWAWVPLEGWKVTRQTNKYNPYEQDYSQF